MKTRIALIMLALGLAGSAIAQTPADVITTAPAGKEVDFTVTVTAGTPPLSYQWKKNGSPVAGAIAATFALTNVQVVDSGTYTVTIANAAGSVDSLNSAVLTVTPPPVPPSGAVISQPVVK